MGTSGLKTARLLGETLLPGKLGRRGGLACSAQKQALENGEGRGGREGLPGMCVWRGVYKRA